MRNFTEAEYIRDAHGNLDINLMWLRKIARESNDCKSCGGTGGNHDPDARPDAPCSVCNGTGKSTN